MLSLSYDTCKHVSEVNPVLYLPTLTQTIQQVMLRLALTEMSAEIQGNITVKFHVLNIS
jgi:hypothetical protein